MIIVADTSYPGEYSLVKEALKKVGAEVVVGIVSKNLNINYDLDFTEEVKEDALRDYDVVAFIGGYWAYFAATGKKVPRRVNPMVNTDSLNKLLTHAINSGKKTILPLTMPAYAAKLGLLKGKKATVYPTTDLIRILRDNGAEFTDTSPTVDGSLITMSRLNQDDIVRVLSVAPAQ